MYAYSGSVWWKAVSKIATCFVPGSSSLQASMPARLAGLCRGASSEHFLIWAMTLSVWGVIGGGALAATAGLAVLEILEAEQLVAKVAERAVGWHAELRQHASQSNQRQSDQGVRIVAHNSFDQSNTQTFGLGRSGTVERLLAIEIAFDLRIRQRSKANFDADELS